MGVLSRMTTLIKVKVNSLLGSAEDPREMLDYSYEKQLQMLQDVKRGVVEVTTSKRRIELQKNKLQESVDKLGNQARQAMSQDREDLARQALERRSQLQQQMEGLDQQIATLEKDQAKLEQAEQRLRSKLESFRSRKETIKAQYSAAEAQVRIGEAVSGISEEMADIGMAIDRAEEKTQDMQARSGAIDELIESGTLEDFTSSGQDPIERELGQMSMRDNVDSELEAIKKELGKGDESKQLGEGKSE
ncbi:MAG: PspA/IM30 family protein [Thermomicrobiaceae bacterium]